MTVAVLFLPWIKIASTMKRTCIQNKTATAPLPLPQELQVDALVSTPACWVLVPCSPEAVADGGTYILALRRISATTQCLRLLKGLEGSNLT
uniref:Pco066552 n=1 Tax=Arundo donax TaxID=35708 RepID=A0A0A9HB59_ARUDO